MSGAQHTPGPLQRLRDAALDPMWSGHAEVSKTTLTEAAWLIDDLLNALQAMENAYGPYASTPKANRCYPTQREINQNQRRAMDRARAAIAKAIGAAS